MNRFLKVVALLLALTVAGTSPRYAAADGFFREDGDFKQLISAAEYYVKYNRGGDAARFYSLAAKKATTDSELAQAYLGAGKHTPIRYGKPDPTTDGVAKLEHYQKLLDLPAAPAAARIDAYFGKAETEAALKRYDAALASLNLLVAIPEVTAQQKRKRLLWTGQILTDAARYDEARADLNALINAADSTLNEQLLAHQSITRTYMRQVNLSAALAQIRKINFMNGFTDTQRADNHLSNAALLTEFGRHPEARAELERVAVLADAPNDRSLQARLSIGHAFYSEKNYAKATEVWLQVLDMRGGAVHAKVIWQAVGVGYAEAKDYVKAREAYQKWLAVPGLDVKSKVQAWQYTGHAYLQEKNYAAAREAIANIDKGTYPTTFDGSALYLRRLMDTADIYAAEGDFVGVVASYNAMLDHIKTFAVTLMGTKPQDHYEAPRQIKAVADKLSQDKATMATAYSIYEALEKFYPYELQKAEADLGMGDILLAQGKPVEARAMYEKALALRKNYNEGKIAREKLAALDAAKTAAVP